jgi:mRNA interferase RelE/StbE
MYSVKYHKQVIKFLQKQDKKVVAKIVSFFDDIKCDIHNIENYDVKELKGFDNKYRLRVSKYRVIFSIYDNILLIEVIKANSRGDIYK